MSSGSWRPWPIHYPGLIDELVRRVKFEIDQRSNGDHRFEIGDLRFWFSSEDYSLQRFIGPESWYSSMILRGEMNTLVFLEWGAQEDAQHALDILRRLHVLEDISRVE